MALVAVALVSIVAMAGLSIDVGTLYQASAEAQRAADAGALAAARTMSMLSVTGDPLNGAASGTWTDVCGSATSPASLAASTVAGKNPISGASIPPSVTVTYSIAGGTQSTDCTGVGSLRFGVNPLVTVVVQQTNLPTYFARIWGRTGNTVSASATAEVFNPSNSALYAGNMVPVQPRCVKPWLVPNLDPVHSAGCTTACSPFVDPATGSIQTPGMYTTGGVIGERFWLLADCTGPGNPKTCNLRNGTPQANFGGDAQYTHLTPNLEYAPGLVASDSTAVPSDGSNACSASASPDFYAESIAGCDQLTAYHCGQASPTQQAAVDLTENPTFVNSDTTDGVQCLIHQATPGIITVSGQDALLPVGGPPPSYPFEIQTGTSNPLLNAGLPANSVITGSSSIVSLPIYDSTNTITQAGPNKVTIVGFLQVFINAADTFGNVYVTVLNVSGCGNNVANPALVLNGTSPVPVRLITPQ